MCNDTDTLHLQGKNVDLVSSRLGNAASGAADFPFGAALLWLEVKYRAGEASG